jgi:hypothetical protein
MADGIKELEAMKTALSALEKLDPEGRERALNWLASSLEVDLASSGPGNLPSDNGQPENVGESGSTVSNEDSNDPKTFLASKNPESDIERVTCLAYFLAKRRAQRTFTTRDLTELNTEAAGRAIGNPAQAVADAVRYRNYLASAGGGSRQMTRYGEEVVEALPNRDAVKAVTDKIPKKKRRKAKAKKAKK